MVSYTLMSLFSETRESLNKNGIFYHNLDFDEIDFGNLIAMQKLMSLETRNIHISYII